MMPRNIDMRDTQDSDLEYIVAAESHADNIPYIGQWSRTEHRASFSDANIKHWLAIGRESGDRVGFAILKGINPPGSPIEIKRMAITQKGQGYGRSLMRQIKTLAFEDLNRHRLWLDVKPGNRRARNLYVSEGFQYEGTLRDCLKTDHGYESLEVMSLLATDLKSDDQFAIGDRQFRFVSHLTKQHLRQVFELYQSQWPNPDRTEEDMYKAVLGSASVVGVVDQQTGDLIGFCRVLADRGYHAWIAGLLVRNDFRGLGLGRKIMNRVLSFENVRATRSLRLACASDVIEFYRKWDFEIFEGIQVMKRDQQS